LPRAGGAAKEYTSTLTRDTGGVNRRQIELRQGIIRDRFEEIVADKGAISRRLRIQPAERGIAGMVANGVVLCIRRYDHDVLPAAVDRRRWTRATGLHIHVHSQRRLVESLRKLSPNLASGLVNFPAVSSELERKSERIVDGLQLQLHFAPEGIGSAEFVSEFVCHSRPIYR